MNKTKLEELKTSQSHLLFRQSIGFRQNGSGFPSLQINGTFQIPATFMEKHLPDISQMIRNKKQVKANVSVGNFDFDEKHKVKLIKITFHTPDQMLQMADDQKSKNESKVPKKPYFWQPSLIKENKYISLSGSIPNPNFLNNVVDQDKFNLSAIFDEEIVSKNYSEICRFLKISEYIVVCKEDNSIHITYSPCLCDYEKLVFKNTKFQTNLKKKMHLPFCWEKPEEKIKVETTIEAMKKNMINRNKIIETLREQVRKSRSSANIKAKPPVISDPNLFDDEDFIDETF